MYWPQSRLVEDLIATHDDLANLDDADDLATYLKTRDMVIVCGRGTLTIGDAAGGPMGRPVAEVADGAGHGEATEDAASTVGEPADGEAEPLPSSGRWVQQLQMRNPESRETATQQQTPHRSHWKSE